MNKSLIPVGTDRAVARRDTNPFSFLQQEIDRLFESPLTELVRGSQILSGWTPALDVYEDKDNVYVRAELPGMKRATTISCPHGRFSVECTIGRRTEQAHVCIGWRGVAQEHPDKYPLDMLNAILGEGMSSRLFLELREILTAIR